MSSDWPEKDKTRRRLSKAPPASHSQAQGQSLGHGHGSNAPHLRRAPSAPIGKKYSAQAPPPAHHTRNPTADGNWAANSTSHAADARLHPYQHYPDRLSLHQRNSSDFIGQRFDSAAVIQSFNQVPYSTRDTPPPPLAEPQPAPQAPADPYPTRPPNFVHANTTPAHSLAPELAQSFQATTGRKMEEVRGPRQRYSDEVKDTRGLKKKSGFSSFFNLSSPRRPNISAPENPVHVTHVGYDQETGEFTVRVVRVFSASREANALFAPMACRHIRRGDIRLCFAPSHWNARNIRFRKCYAEEVHG